MSAKRSYNSARRKEQALETRRQIVEAARSLFLSRGYAGATIEAIAAQAGVAPETVYAAFGSKRAVLARLLETSVVGDESPVPLLERSGPQAVRRETDQSRQVELFVEDIHKIMNRTAPLFEVLRTAGHTEPEIAEMLNGILESRLGGMMFFVRALMKNGPLRAGLTAESAAETVWLLTSGEVFMLLKGDRGWTDARYKGWLADALKRLLLE